ncbi:MAG: hypothetical protein V3T22_03085 [Planctomycetota bacterium]
MIHCTRFAPLAFALCPLADSPGESLRFAPAQGSSLTLSFQVERRLVGGELEVVMGGVEVPLEYLPVFDLEVASTYRVVLTDRYQKIELERVTEFARTYDEVEMRVNELQAMTEASQSDASTSEADARADAQLSGRTVRFRWDADSKEYERSYEGERGDEDERALLDGLEAAADLSGFLPVGAVSRGATWEVDAAVLAVLVNPGGDLGLVWEGELAAEYSTVPEEVSFDGTLLCKLSALHDRDGVSLATITVEGECTMVQVTLTNLERVPVIDGDATETLTSNYEVEGEFTWNLDAGHLVELELEANLEVESHLVRTPGQPGPEFESRVRLTGTETWSVQVRAGE